MKLSTLQPNPKVLERVLQGQRDRLSRKEYDDLCLQAIRVLAVNGFSVRAIHELLTHSYEISYEKVRTRVRYARSLAEQKQQGD